MNLDMKVLFIYLYIYSFIHSMAEMNFYKYAIGIITYSTFL